MGGDDTVRWRELRIESSIEDDICCGSSKRARQQTLGASLGLIAPFHRGPSALMIARSFELLH